VDQQANHFQPHDRFQPRAPFEGIGVRWKQATESDSSVRDLKNSQPSPDTGGFGLATIKEQIELIRAEIDKTQKNKATNAHIGKLKAKIAQLKLKEERTAAHSKASGGGKGFEVRKSGDATVALVGFPSVGKSTLISKVTDAHSETGGYAFTTLTCIPGVMEHRGAKIQILDLPGLIKGAAEGKGRGREILNVIRSADMVLYIVDPFQDGHFNVLHRELHNAGLRLNEIKPPVFINRTERGGIEIRSTVEQTHLEDEEIADIIRTFGFTSALVTLREDSTAEQIVDALAGNRVYEKAVIAVNKIDIATEHDIARARSALPQDWPIMNISAFKDIGLDELKDFIYENLGFMRVFLKPQGQEADMDEPLIVKDDSTVENICIKLHRDFVRKFRYARVRGPSAKFDDQRVGLDHQLKDGDVLTIVVKR
jgi:ribosome-interacting GTPase 1